MIMSFKRVKSKINPEIVEADVNKHSPPNPWNLYPVFTDPSQSTPCIIKILFAEIGKAWSQPGFISTVAYCIGPSVICIYLPNLLNTNCEEARLDQRSRCSICSPKMTYLLSLGTVLSTMAVHGQWIDSSRRLIDVCKYTKETNGRRERGEARTRPLTPPPTWRARAALSVAAGRPLQRPGRQPPWAQAAAWRRLLRASEAPHPAHPVRQVAEPAQT